MTFQEMGLKAQILKAIEALEFHTPTPIQEQAIPALLGSTDDLVSLARTGTGKTAAFGLPLLQLIDPQQRKTQALILAPTRELCLQITADLGRYAREMQEVKIVAVYGGAPISTQIRELGRGAHIVAATPGRAIDLLSRGALSLDAIDYLVLDEADEMLNMGFKDELETILGQTPDSRRTLLFSATMPPEIARISGQYMNNPRTLKPVSGPAQASLVTHQYAVIQNKDRYPALRRFCDAYPDIYGIVFCRTRRETQEVADFLGRDGYPAEAIHGDLSQIQRDAVMNRFRRKQVRLLVATDVAARGIDVKELTHVLNYNLPDDTETYVHRSGRTGRAGKEGLSISLVQFREVRYLKGLEQKTGIKFNPISVPGAAEVWENQIENFLQQLTGEHPQQTPLTPFMPKILKNLENLSREDLIERLLNIEFAKLLEDYQHARDLNDQGPPKDGRRSSERRRWDGPRPGGGKHHRPAERHAHPDDRYPNERKKKYHGNQESRGPKPGRGGYGAKSRKSGGSQQYKP